MDKWIPKVKRHFYHFILKLILHFSLLLRLAVNSLQRELVNKIEFLEKILFWVCECFCECFFIFFIFVLCKSFRSPKYLFVINVIKQQQRVTCNDKKIYWNSFMMQNKMVFVVSPQISLVTNEWCHSVGQINEKCIRFCMKRRTGDVIQILHIERWTSNFRSIWDLNKIGRESQCRCKSDWK